MFFRLKDYRRLATGYGKLVAKFLGIIRLAAAFMWWVLIPALSKLIFNLRFSFALSCSIRVSCRTAYGNLYAKVIRRAGQSRFLVEILEEITSGRSGTHCR